MVYRNRDRDEMKKAAFIGTRTTTTPNHMLWFQASASEVTTVFGEPSLRRMSLVCELQLIIVDHIRLCVDAVQEIYQREREFRCQGFPAPSIHHCGPSPPAVDFSDVFKLFLPLSPETSAAMGLFTGFAGSV